MDTFVKAPHHNHTEITMQLIKLNWKQAEEAFKKDPVVLVPIGSIEQHGPIGPLGTDAMAAEAFANRVAECTNAIVLPTVYYGSAPQHMSFPGSIDIGIDTLQRVLRGITHSLIRHGVRRFLFINGHGGNASAIDQTMFDIYHHGCLAAELDWWAVASNMKPEWKTGHGDCQEVSLAMALDPASVNFDYLEPNEVNHISDALQTVHINVIKFKGHSVKMLRDARAAHSMGGYGGFASGEATCAQGEQMLDAVLAWMVDFTREFETVDPDKARARFSR